MFFLVFSRYLRKKMHSNALVDGCTTHKVEDYIPPDSIQGKRDGLTQFTIKRLCVNVQK